MMCSTFSPFMTMFSEEFCLWALKILDRLIKSGGKKGVSLNWIECWFSNKKIDDCMKKLGLTLYQTTNFRLFQTERVCRRQFQTWRKWNKVIQTGRKHCGKRRNCSLRTISAFPTVFSKGLFSRGIKRCHCVGMGYLSFTKLSPYFIVSLRTRLFKTLSEREKMLVASILSFSYNVFYHQKTISVN